MDSWTVAKALIGGVIAIVAIGCSDSPAPGEDSRAEGKLGNGGFVFGCADGAACRPYVTLLATVSADSNDAAKFPAKVAAGSTFGMRFVRNNAPRPAVLYVNDTQYQGVTVSGLAPFFGTANEARGGIAALQPGVGTLMAVTGDGTVVDYLSMEIVKPAKFVVYDAGDEKADPVGIKKVSLALESGKRFRIVAQSEANQNLAGSINHAWAFDPPDLAEVDSAEDGVTTFVGLREGTGSVTLAAGGLEQRLDVEVTK